jgi:hypothetical protein
LLLLTQDVDFLLRDEAPLALPPACWVSVASRRAALSTDDASPGPPHLARETGVGEKAKRGVANYSSA